MGNVRRRVDSQGGGGCHEAEQGSSIERWGEHPDKQDGVRIRGRRAGLLAEGSVGRPECLSI
jgi:hypothetical protein